MSQSYYEERERAGNSPWNQDHRRLVGRNVRKPSHNYNNTWSLDVECTYNDLVAPTEEGIAMLHDTYDCHEFDDMHRDLVRKGADNFPLFFYFEIGEILKRNNI